MTVSGNRFLTLEEMTINAEYILDYLGSRGWTKNAVCGLLGNLQTESSINSGIWQSLISYDHDPYITVEGHGYGLVQWTPFNKYTVWARDNGLTYSDMDTQLQRIQYEVDNNLQWFGGYSDVMTFQQFTQSLETPEYLAEVFIKTYEHPADPEQPIRGTQARYWFDTLTGEGGTGSKPAFPTTAGLPITSPYGWRTHPITGEQDFHGAIDISGNGVNHPIYATQTGVVVSNVWSDSGGWMLTLQHTGDQYYSRYIHMAVQSPISVGTSVTKGQEIGTMGTTGDSTGIHLDFAISKINGGWNTPENTIDPELYLEMIFDGDPTDPPDPPSLNKNTQVIKMLLADTLNGWRW
jgi:murein DD-endopeptidase MepM/ murein hydrolase activator NlpD